ncbi:hypothetical protein Taro_026893 [Colocasia esculenta]|uniref:Peroxidase n=1 Tax=Colocasia esculenta TaxID=4460 RepID=A0A843VGH3_COLES|nr:hypothetical protein [Colocasia esculenta]
MALKHQMVVFLLHMALLSVVFETGNAAGLKVGFYQKTCPKAESIVRQTVGGYFAKDPTVSAPLLRLHFHDCFVRGCDGSVLLNSTADNVAEKDAAPNMSLDGFFVIDAAKAALEQACPGVVSCADIVALAARDAVSLSQGPSWQVKTGRRDGRVSSAAEAVANLPSSFAEISTLKAQFAGKGLSTKDLAVLSGAHTIGNSHCNSFSNRLYNYTGKGDVDPLLNPKRIPELRAQCKPGDATTVVEMDPGSATTFDTHYYQQVAAGNGLFHSDAALLRDPLTKKYVYQHVGATASFFRDFGVSMVKMGMTGVLTGTHGEIRKNCALVN